MNMNNFLPLEVKIVWDVFVFCGLYTVICV